MSNEHRPENRGEYGGIACFAGRELHTGLLFVGILNCGTASKNKLNFGDKAFEDDWI